MQSYHLYEKGQLKGFLLFDLGHVYVQVDVIVTHIFSWFYIQKQLKCCL